jgi:hypothetical protein
MMLVIVQKISRVGPIATKLPEWSADNYKRNFLLNVRAGDKLAVQ